MERMTVFGVPIDGLAMTETLTRIRDARRPLWIVTANPEILLAARRDPSYAVTLRHADLRLVDGFGLWIILRLFGQRTSRVTGVELAESLIQEAVHRNLKVAFIGGAPGVAEKAADAVRSDYDDLRPTPDALQIHAEQGGVIAQDGSDDAEGEEARTRLTQFGPDILLVAFGHPKQERWIEKYLSDFPSVKVVVGIGGTLEYWAKTKRRAPIWMRSFGLEWFWRLIVEPRRWKRIVDAVIVFPFSATADRIKNRSRRALR